MTTTKLLEKLHQAEADYLVLLHRVDRANEAHWNANSDPGRRLYKAMKAAEDHLYSHIGYLQAIRRELDRRGALPVKKIDPRTLWENQ